MKEVQRVSWVCLFGDSFGFGFLGFVLFGDSFGFGFLGFVLFGDSFGFGFLGFVCVEILHPTSLVNDIHTEAYDAQGKREYRLAELQG